MKRALTTAESANLSKFIRVNQAGELAAVYIYRAQLAVFAQTRPDLKNLIAEMLSQEVHHRKTFNAVQVRRRVRPSLLTPVWKAAAWTLGASTALLGKEAAMACTEAVETVIGGHYNSQLRYLHQHFGVEAKNSNEMAELLANVKQFRDDELEHLDTAVEHDAHGARPYWLMTEVIKNGCRGAIAVAERV